MNLLGKIQAELRILFPKGMRKLVILMLSGSLILATLLYVIQASMSLSRENVLTILGFYFVLCGSFLAFAQIGINLRFNQRKAARFYLRRGDNDLPSPPRSGRP